MPLFIKSGKYEQIKKMSSTKYIIGLLVFLVAGCWQAAGQRYPERRHIRSGNRDYEKLDYVAAEEKYRTAVSKNDASFEAAFNIGDALYKQEWFDEAENAFGKLLENKTLTGQQTAKTLYNLGNAQFAGQKLKEAAESYMRSLIINPNDLEAKYNLAYVQKLLDHVREAGIRVSAVHPCSSAMEGFFFASQYPRRFQEGGLRRNGAARAGR